MRPIVTGATLFNILIALAYFNLTKETIFFANDQATDFIIAKLASEGAWPLLGPPSHTGGRHLGPIYYWYVIGAALLTDFDIVSATYLFTATKLAAIIFLGWCLSNILCGVPLVGALLGLFVAFFSQAALDILRIAWHSNYLLIPSSLAFGSAMLVVFKGAKYLTLFFPAITTLFLSHLSAGPAVVCIALALFTFLLMPENRSETVAQLKRAPTIGSMVLSALLFIPTVLFETRYESNLSRLTTIHTGHAENAGLLDAARTLIKFVSVYGLGIPEDRVFTRISAVTFLFFGCLLFYYFISKGGKFRWALIILSAPLFGTALALSAFKPPLYLHYFKSSIAAPCILTALSFAAAFELAQKVGLRTLIAIIYLLLALVRAGIHAPKVLSSLSDPAPHGIYSLSHAEVISEAIRERNPLEKIVLFARLDAKTNRNALYYLLNVTHPEMEYRGFFPELPTLQKFPDTDRFSTLYLVICPAPFRHARDSILKPFRARGWVQSGEIEAQTAKEERICEILILKRIGDEN